MKTGNVSVRWLSRRKVKSTRGRFPTLRWLIFYVKIKVERIVMREDLEQQEQMQNLKAFWKANGKWITSSSILCF